MPPFISPAHALSYGERESGDYQTSMDWIRRWERRRGKKNRKKIKKGNK
jgi:hypothetical protein